MTTTTKHLCGTCGASPCYLICPTQDPYAGDPWAEHCDYEAGVGLDRADEIDVLDPEPELTADEAAAMAVWVAEDDKRRAEERARIEAERAAVEADGGVWF